MSWQPCSGPINLNGFLSYLIGNWQISPDKYVSGIQLGNETVSGFGKLLIRHYEIRFCNKFLINRLCRDLFQGTDHRHNPSLDKTRDSAEFSLEVLSWVCWSLR